MERPPDEIFEPLCRPTHGSPRRLGIPGAPVLRRLVSPPSTSWIEGATPVIGLEEVRGEACLLRCSHHARTPARTTLAPPSASTIWALTCEGGCARTARTTTTGIGVGCVCVRAGAREPMRKPKIRIPASMSQQGGPRTDRET